MYSLKEQKVIIYGTGLLGRKTCELLEREGIKVTAFIDKRYIEIKSFMGKPVYGLSDIEEIPHKEKYAFIITIKNVYDHSEIANQLVKGGFDHIICKPYDVLHGKSGRITESIDRAYEQLISRCQIYLEQIEEYTKGGNCEIEDSGFILTQGKYIKAYINATLLFTNQAENMEYDSLNFVSTFPGVEMYYALDNQRLGRQHEIFTDFIYFCEEGARKCGMDISESWKKNVIENRSNIFGEMKRMYSLCKNFFVENCPVFEYLGNGKFRIISSGKNRISFLISQGEWYVPVQMEESHYKKYINMEQAKAIYNLLGNDSIWCSIPHPMFYDRRVIAYNYLDTWVPIVGRYVSCYVKEKTGTYEFSSIYVEDYSIDDGCISRHLSRMGCKIGRRNRTELAKKLDKLFLFDEEEFKLEDRVVDINIETYYDALSVEEDVMRSRENTKLRFVLLVGSESKKKFWNINLQYGCPKLIFESVWEGKEVEGYML